VGWDIQPDNERERERERRKEGERGILPTVSRRKKGSAGKCTAGDNGFIECEIAEFAGSTLGLAA
jgi:hypothetical protein